MHQRKPMQQQWCKVEVKEEPKEQQYDSVEGNQEEDDWEVVTWEVKLDKDEDERRIGTLKVKQEPLEKRCGLIDVEEDQEEQIIGTVSVKQELHKGQRCNGKVSAVITRHPNHSYPVAIDPHSIQNTVKQDPGNRRRNVVDRRRFREMEKELAEAKLALKEAQQELRQYRLSPSGHQQPQLQEEIKQVLPEDVEIRTNKLSSPTMAELLECWERNQPHPTLKKRLAAVDVLQNLGIPSEEDEDTVKRRKTRMKGDYTCDDCGKFFSYKSNLIRHKSSKVQKFICPDCGKVFRRNDYLKEHTVRCLKKTKYEPSGTKSDKSQSDNSHQMYVLVTGTVA